MKTENKRNTKKGKKKENKKHPYKTMFLFVFGMIFLFGILGSVSAAAPSASGTVAYYPFNLTSGAVQDLTNNHNGTISGTVTRGVTGIYQNGFKFDGSTGYVNTGFNFNGASTDWTVSFWVKPTSTGSYTFFSTDTSNTAPRGFQIQESSGNIYLFDGNSGHAGTTSIGSGSFVYLTIVKHSTVTEVYKNGVWSENISTSYNSVSKPLLIGQRSTSNPSSFYNGVMDEASIFNYSLTPSEISYLYGSGSPGAAQQYPYQGLSIAPRYPTNNSYINNSSPNFNATITNAGVTVTVTTFNLYYSNGTLINHQSKSYSTNSSFNESYTDGTLADGTYKYNINAQSASSNATTGNITFTIDTHPPVVNVSSPTGTYDYLYTGKNLTLNTTISDNINIASAWYSYNGTNHTISVTNGTLYSQNFAYQGGKNNLTVYANDSAGNLASSTTTWSPLIFENSRTLNSSTYETANENFKINLTANSSLTNVYLNYSGTKYETTQSGNIWSYTMDIPTSKVANNSVNWIMTYAGTNYSTTYSYQNVQNLVFTLCNATYTHKFLNISFEDENNFSKLSATIPTSNFVYYLGSGAVNKTYTYSKTTNNTEYDFCVSPNSRQLKVVPYVQYKNGVNYPQRIWNPSVQTYNSTLTDQILYMLSSTDGIYVTFQVINPAEQGISGVTVTGTRTISGKTVQIASGTTGAGGGVTFWLNPDFSHTFTFTKSGYDTYTTSLTPTQSTYTVTLGGTQSVTPDYTQGISLSITPKQDFILANQTQDFNYTISSDYYNLDNYSFTLEYSNGTQIVTKSGTGNTGGTLSYSFSPPDNQRIVMRSYYTINGTQVYFIRYWYTYKENSFSLNHLFGDISTYIGDNIFGIQGNDSGYFSKALLSILIIIITAGLLSTRYGLASEPAVSGIIFGLVLLLNTLGFIPTLSNFPYSGASINLGVLLEIVTALMAIIFIFREESY